MSLNVVIFCLRCWSLQPRVWVPMSLTAVLCWMGACLSNSTWLAISLSVAPALVFFLVLFVCVVYFNVKTGVK